MLKSYKELIVWQKSMKLVEEIYSITDNFQPKEQYTLTSQIRRAAISIPSNIAEGYGRNTSRNYVQFLHVSKGSLFELETQIELSRRLNYISEEVFCDMELKITEIDKMLHSLIFKLKERV